MGRRQRRRERHAPKAKSKAALVPPEKWIFYPPVSPETYFPDGVNLRAAMSVPLGDETEAIEEADASWEAPSQAEREELKKRYPKGGFSLKRDGKGLFIHTHRARSKSYPSVADIPVSVMDFIESTG